MTKLEKYDSHLKVGGRKRASTSNDDSQISTKQKKLTEYKSAVDKQKKLDEHIILYIVLGIKPLSTVEDENFIRIFKGNFIIINIF